MGHIYEYMIYANFYPSKSLIDHAILPETIKEASFTSSDLTFFENTRIYTYIHVYTPTLYVYQLKT